MMNRQAETNVDLRTANIPLFRNLPPDYLQALGGLLLQDLSRGRDVNDGGTVG